MTDDSKLSINAFIDNHRLTIGSILLVLVLCAGTFLLYRENYLKPKNDSLIAGYSAKIDELESEIAKIQDQKNAEVKSESTPSVNSELPAQADPAPTIAKATTPSKTTTPKTTTKSSPVVENPVGKININTASAAEFDKLPAIGPVLSQRIVDYRTTNGVFGTIEDIKKVSGIGDKTFLKFKDLITI